MRRKKVVAFFHPYTNDGGSERVFWCAFRVVQEERPDLDCVVYTGDRDASLASLRARAADRFGVELLSAPQEIDCRDVESSKKLIAEEDEEEKEQCSPVLVLDPPFEDGHDQEEEDGDGFDYECSFANV